jgi:hypothetical protein
MSAWIVSKAHIDALVTGLVVLGMRADARPSEAELAKLGRELWRENHRSVNARYSERTRMPRYVYTEHAVDEVTLLKLVHCYGYQSCEHDGWGTSSPRLMMALLASLLEARGVTRRSPGYDAAPWGIGDAA